MIPTGYPYFRWWVKDADADEFYLTASDAEIGFYHRCLNRSWNSGGLPADPEARARLLGKTRSYADKMWAVIGVKFHPSEVDPSRLVNRKQEEERSYVHSMSERNSRAGKSRNKTSTTDEQVLEQVLDECKTNGHQRAYGSGSVSGSSENTSNSESTSPRAKLPVEEWFVEFWSLYWRKVDRANAFKAFKKYATDEKTKTRIIDAVRAQTSQYAARESDKRPHAATWLNGRRYEDDPEVYQPAMSKLDRIMEAL